MKGRTALDGAGSLSLNFYIHLIATVFRSPNLPNRGRFGKTIGQAGGLNCFA